MRFRLKTFIRKIRFYGRRYFCPLCESNLRKLRPRGYNFPVLAEKKVIGGGYRAQAQCPVCKSTDRERLLFLYLTRKTDLPNERLSMLHVAPEPALSAFLRELPNLEYLSADLNPDIAMVQLDITRIGYPEGNFDVVICNHVLEHIIDDAKAMRELYRVLRPGGWGILQVPISLALERTFEDFSITTEAQREQVFGQSDHVRIYAKDYVERLRDSGFIVAPYDWWANDDFVGQDNRFGLLQDETLFLVRKPA